MSACCSPFECAADQQFNQKKATEELTRYRTKGPGRTTRLLQQGLEHACARAPTDEVSDVATFDSILIL
jgi:hypothetical protein